MLAAAAAISLSTVLLAAYSWQADSARIQSKVDVFSVKKFSESEERYFGYCTELSYGESRLLCSTGSAVVFRMLQRRLLRKGVVTIGLENGAYVLTISGRRIDSGPAFIVDEFSLRGKTISLQNPARGICEPSYGSSSIIRDGLRCVAVLHDGKTIFVYTQYRAQ